MVKECSPEPSAMTSRNETEAESVRDSDCRKNVRFSTLEIREYPMCMGDSPACARGIPIAIGWEYITAHTDIPVDEYELLRPRRREKQELKMESLDRIRLLKQEGFGYSRKEIQEAISEVDKERRRRQKTRNWLRLAPIEEACETVIRDVLHCTIWRSRKHRMDQYLEPFKNQGQGKKKRRKRERKQRERTKRNTSKNSSTKEDMSKAAGTISQLSSDENSLEETAITVTSDGSNNAEKGSKGSGSNSTKKEKVRNGSSVIDMAGGVRKSLTIKLNDVGTPISKSDESTDLTEPTTHTLTSNLSEETLTGIVEH